MENLAPLFHSIRQDNPNLSSYVCLLRALENKNVGKKMCEFYFTNLVDKADYEKDSKEELIGHLVRVSKSLI